jgi:hypothetical protein
MSGADLIEGHPETALAIGSENISCVAQIGQVFALDHLEDDLPRIDPEPFRRGPCGLEARGWIVDGARCEVDEEQAIEFVLLGLLERENSRPNIESRDAIECAGGSENLCGTQDRSIGSTGTQEGLVTSGSTIRSVDDRLEGAGELSIGLELLEPDTFQCGSQATQGFDRGNLGCERARGGSDRGSRAVEFFLGQALEGYPAELLEP